MGPNERTLAAMCAYTERATRAYVLGAVDAVVDASQRRTPVDTHFAQASWTVAIGGVAPGWPQRSNAKNHSVPSPEVLVLTGADEFVLGDTIAQGNTARHTNIIAGGRRPDRNGRMIGSDQAPDPFIPLAIQDGIVAMEAWRFAG